jgi:hypothetical protein
MGLWVEEASVAVAVAVIFLDLVALSVAWPPSLGSGKVGRCLKRPRFSVVEEASLGLHEGSFMTFQQPPRPQTAQEAGLTNTSEVQHTVAQGTDLLWSKVGHLHLWQEVSPKSVSHHPTVSGGRKYGDTGAEPFTQVKAGCLAGSRVVQGERIGDPSRSSQPFRGCEETERKGPLWPLMGNLT